MTDPDHVLPPSPISSISPPTQFQLQAESLGPVMRRHSWPALAFLFSILMILTTAHPSHPRSKTPPKPSPLQKKKKINRHLLLPRTDPDPDDSSPFLGPEWDILTMENHAAYTPLQTASSDLSSFYTSLQTIAQQNPIHQVISYFTHRINRVSITFQTSPLGIQIPMSLVLRFANRMLEFTNRGYASSYRIVFRHVHFGFLVQVLLVVDELLMPEVGEGSCDVVAEEHGEVNASGVRQTCVLRGPSFPR